MKKLLTLALLTATGLVAQPQTYTMKAPFRCDVSNTQPLTTFYEFSCRGVQFVDANGTTQATLFWFSTLGFYVVTPSGTINGTRKSKVTVDQTPNEMTPVTFQVQFQIQTADGLFHVFQWTGTYVAGDTFFRNQDFPFLESGSLQVDQSTVAILD